MVKYIGTAPTGLTIEKSLARTGMMISSMMQSFYFLQRKYNIS
jgi:hypothetical protein